jgi:hypothetical protein
MWGRGGRSSYGRHAPVTRAGPLFRMAQPGSQGAEGHTPEHARRLQVVNDELRAREAL